jgi:hypothetical protein
MKCDILRTVPVPAHDTPRPSHPATPDDDRSNSPSCALRLARSPVLCCCCCLRGPTQEDAPLWRGLAVTGVLHAGEHTNKNSAGACPVCGGGRQEQLTRFRRSTPLDASGRALGGAFFCWVELGRMTSDLTGGRAWGEAVLLCHSANHTHGRQLEIAVDRTRS